MQSLKKVLQWASGTSILWISLSFLLLEPTAYARRLNIVTTTTDLASITRAIAGEHAEVKSLTTGAEDPHFLQAKPSYILMARDADLWIRIGMELEVGWEPAILDGARNRRILPGSPGHLDASERVLRLDVPTGPVTRAMGDVHPEGNPHYWLDPFNGRRIAETIAERLKRLLPENTEDFERNLAAFEKGLDGRMFGEPLLQAVEGAMLWLHLIRGDLEGFLKGKGLENRLGGWLGRMKPHQGKGLVAYHRSWIYFTSRFGLVIAAELEPKPGIPPSASHLQEVIEKVKSGSVRLVLVEPFYSRKAADLVASRTGASVVVCSNSVGGQPEATDYLALLDLLVTKVSGAL